MRNLRKRAIRHYFDVEPSWRRPVQDLSTGYEAGQ